MGAVQITNDIWWVGVQNPTLRVFDVVMETKWGTSYNSYLVKGNDKIALIDSVRDGYLEEQLKSIREICDPSKIDYIICNHMEPDHSGSLQAMMEIATNAVIVCSRAAKTLVGEITNHDDYEFMVVGDDDSIDLGGKTLEFVSAPYLHWPDTIFTYAKEDKVLFTCDAFGFHYSVPEIFDDLMTENAQDIQFAQKYYFDVIVSPFKPYVLQAIEKAGKLDIAVIAPSHGPVLRDDPMGAVERYAKWSQPTVNNPKKIYIAYVSCYGYTKILAEEVKRGALASGTDVEIEIEEITSVGPETVAAKITAADGFALGSPTLNRDALPPLWVVMADLGAYTMKGKKAAVFGTFGWSGEACKFMEQRLTNLGATVVGEARAKLNPSSEELKLAYDLGMKLADALN